VKHKSGGSKGLRVVVLSGLSAFAAPLVFVSVIVIRKADRRGRAHARRLNKRFQNELARWT
jgi:hypothetical protein